MVFKQSEKWSIGFWLGLVTVLSFLSRSWSVALVGFIVVAVFMLPRFLACLSNNTTHRLSVATNVVYVFLFFLGILVGIERIYLGSADSYPRWLASGEIGTLDGPTLNQIVETSCKDQGTEIFRKSDMTVVRCGYSWFDPRTKTYIAEK